MIRIPYGKHYLDQADIDSVVGVLKHGYLTQGPMVAAFEEAVAHLVGAKYAVAVSNGTAALHLAYNVLGLSVGDIVITSPNTFVASANGAAYLGGRVRFADIDPKTLNVSTASLEAQCEIYPDVKVITPVHFAGLACDMPAIKSVADKYGACIIEDAAHALGAMYEDGSKVGNCRYSDLTIFSFHPVKMIAAGEGGMITTNSEILYKKLLRLRSHGINKGDDPYIYPDAACEQGMENPWYYEMQELGFNYRLTDIQSALGRSQISKVSDFLAKRQALADVYDNAFCDSEIIHSAQPPDLERANARHLYVVRMDLDSSGVSRSAVMRELVSRGIGTQVHYIPVHYHPYYQRQGFKKGDFPETEQYYKECLSIPLYYSLKDSEQQEVINALREVLG